MSNEELVARPPGAPEGAAAGQAPPFCLACWSPVAEWVPGGPRGRPRARCPRCGALERHRFLAFMLEQLGLVVATSGAVLDVAPQRQVQHVLKRLAGEAYVGMDLSDELDVDVRADITRLPFADATFDLVVCYHVLEHIPDDRRAIAELARVLAPGGVALVQVPWRDDRDTDEDPDAPVSERADRFGQDDHVRWYGRDFESRLAASGLRPYRLKPSEVLEEAELRRLSITPGEAVWLCRRSGVPGDGLPEAPLLRGVRRIQPYAGGWSFEIDAALREAELARADRERLLARRTVRAALALAALTRPLFRLTRRLRPRP